MKILMSSFVVYLLRLEQGKYYVGRTDNMENRWRAHKTGKGSLWTKKYRPLEILNTYQSKNPFEEDKYTKECMALYGIDNVRGGSYVRDILDLDAKRLIQKEIWAAKDCCVRCGRNSHFVKECCFDTNIYGENIGEQPQQPQQQENLSLSITSMNESIVYMCGHCDKEFEVETDCDKHMENCEKNVDTQVQVVPVPMNRHFFLYSLLTVPNMIGVCINLAICMFLFSSK